MVEGGYNRIFIVEGHFPLQSPPMGRQYVDHSTTFPHVLFRWAGWGWGISLIGALYDPRLAAYIHN